MTDQTRCNRSQGLPSNPFPPPADNRGPGHQEKSRMRYNQGSRGIEAPQPRKGHKPCPVRVHQPGQVNDFALGPGQPAVGETSWASILREQSRAIMISTPFWVVFPSGTRPKGLPGPPRQTCCEYGLKRLSPIWDHRKTRQNMVMHSGIAYRARIFLCRKIPYTITPASGRSPHKKNRIYGCSNFMCASL